MGPDRQALEVRQKEVGRKQTVTTVMLSKSDTVRTFRLLSGITTLILPGLTQKLSRAPWCLWEKICILVLQQVVLSLTVHSSLWPSQLCQFCDLGQILKAPDLRRISLKWKSSHLPVSVRILGLEEPQKASPCPARAWGI